MPSFFLPFVFLSLSLAASADPLLSPWRVHERRAHLPAGWSLARKHDPNAVIPLRFALAQPNLERLEEYLHDVSHPGSPNYGQHWSAGKVASTFAPSRESIDAVRTWMHQSGIEPQRMKVSQSGGWVQLKTTVWEAEDLLHTQYNVYSHVSGAEHVACESYHLPEHLGRHVDFVTPTVHFDARVSKHSGGRESLGSIGTPGLSTTSPKAAEILQDLSGINGVQYCDSFITPECLRALYQFMYTPMVPENNSYGITEYTPQSYRQEDLNIFAQQFGKDLDGVSPEMVSIDGGALSPNQSFGVNAESNLDLEYAMNLVTKQQDITLYQVGDLVEGGSFNNFLDALDGSYCNFEGGDDPSVDHTYPDKQTGGYKGPEACGGVKRAHVISTSYGYDEADLTLRYASRQCAEYGKLGLMGVTFLYSSGDFGVAGNNKTCLNPNGSQTADGKIFNPGFPATCPWVTAVGATQVSPGKTVLDPESACQQVIHSGGGFSNYFGMPEYQKDAVTSYLKNSPPPYPKDIWNATGSRAYPDLAANGANYVVALDGNFTLLYGTSASSPVVGAMLAMVNDARISQGKSPIGFINPLIYGNFSDAFHDITNGTNPGCGTVGFSTSEGWDPVTGVGTPNFEALLLKWSFLP